MRLIKRECLSRVSVKMDPDHHSVSSITDPMWVVIFKDYRRYFLAHVKCF